MTDRLYNVIIFISDCSDPLQNEPWLAVYNEFESPQESYEHCVNDVNFERNKINDAVPGPSCQRHVRNTCKRGDKEEWPNSSFIEEIKARLMKFINSI